MNEQIKDEVQSFPDEIEHFKIINTKLDAALAAAVKKAKLADKEYLDSKKYMSDYRGELDPHEMFQNELALKQIDRTAAFKVEIWKELAKLKESPYFARIDFLEDGEESADRIYIGRFSFMYENELLIFDWRSPIASMFYDYELGPARYSAPIGTIEGDLIRKRQFKIKNGKLDYVLESSLNIQDDVLQRELSCTADEKMKAIISTIQKEQNQIIRNEKARSIIIQGVAGSGKTSIALHRIAFLLYRYKNQLSAKNVTIISPNKVFGDYISTVLPELGEEPIYELSFVELANMQLKGVIAFEPEKDPVETEDVNWAKRVNFKSTLKFVKLIETYLEELSTSILLPEDYNFEHFSVSAAFIQERFQAYHAYPFKLRLLLIADDIYNRLSYHNTMNDKLPRPRIILKSLNKMLKIKNSLALYKEFYKWLELPKMLVLPAKQTLEWIDVYPFLYFHAAFEGIQKSKLIKHLVIDEMQDYTPIQFAVINRLFPCQKTILGDFGQNVNPYHISSLEDIQSLYQDAILVELTKSYRSTYEIITFANRIQPVRKLEPMERHGDVPTMVSSKNDHDKLLSLKEELELFKKSEWTSLGIIVKTNTAAKSLYEQLSLDYNIHFISPESTSFKSGISITSIGMSKGLEFDVVIVLDVNDDNYKSESDRSLLYIAVTRAMHRLIIMYTGNPSQFLLI